MYISLTLSDVIEREKGLELRHRGDASYLTNLKDPEFLSVYTPFFHRVGKNGRDREALGLAKHEDGFYFLFKEPLEHETVLSCLPISKTRPGDLYNFVITVWGDDAQNADSVRLHLVKVNEFSELASQHLILLGRALKSFEGIDARNHYFMSAGELLCLDNGVWQFNQHSESFMTPREKLHYGTDPRLTERVLCAKNPLHTFSYTSMSLSKSHEPEFQFVDVLAKIPMRNPVFIIAKTSRQRTYSYQQALLIIRSFKLRKRHQTVSVLETESGKLSEVGLITNDLKVATACLQSPMLERFTQNRKMNYDNTHLEMYDYFHLTGSTLNGHYLVKKHFDVPFFGCYDYEVTDEVDRVCFMRVRSIATMDMIPTPLPCNFLLPGHFACVDIEQRVAPLLPNINLGIRRKHFSEFKDEYFALFAHQHQWGRSMNLHNPYAYQYNHTSNTITIREVEDIQRTDERWYGLSDSFSIEQQLLGLWSLLYWFISDDSPFEILSENTYKIEWFHNQFNKDIDAQSNPEQYFLHCLLGDILTPCTKTVQEKIDSIQDKYFQTKI